MIIDGYDIRASGDLIYICEVGETRSWRAMVEFSNRFPTGFEPEWEGFINKHTAMQNAEITAALRKFKLATH